MRSFGEPAISVRLTLDRPEAIRCESAYFRVAVANTGTDPLRGIHSLRARNRALILRATGAAAYSAHGQSAEHRAGFHSHGPREPDRVDLAPGESMDLSGDLLQWLGEMVPGTYDVTATYVGDGRETVSAPAKLRILPADPVAATTSRPGTRMFNAPLPAAWVHRGSPGGPDAGRFLVFYHEQHAYLPRCPVHAVRAAAVSSAPLPLAALTPGSEDEAAAAEGSWRHVVWLEGGGRLVVAPVNPEDGSRLAPFPVRAPFSPIPLASPLTASAGTLVIPVRDERGARAGVLFVQPDGAARFAEAPLGPQSPIGPNAWLWWHGSRLHAVWCREGSREVSFARLPLDDPDAQFSTAQSVQVDDPVIWLDGYLDQESADLRAEPGGEPVPADPVAWAVVEGKSRVRCARVNLVTRQVSPVCSWATERDERWSVLNSCVTREKHLSLLLRDPAGALFYAGTRHRERRPIAEAAGVPITAAQSPALVTATSGGLAPFVHVRYIDSKQGAIVYRKIEPAEARDPMDEPR